MLIFNHSTKHTHTHMSLMGATITITIIIIDGLSSARLRRLDNFVFISHSLGRHIDYDDDYDYDSDYYHFTAGHNAR